MTKANKYYNDLMKYYDFTLESWAQKTYKDFEKVYIKYLKEIFQEQNYEILKINKGYFYFYMFIKTNGKIIYLSAENTAGDLYNKWYHKILIRLAKNENDSIGSQNHFADLENLTKAINKLSLFSHL